MFVGVLAPANTSSIILENDHLFAMLDATFWYLCMFDEQSFSRCIFLAYAVLYC